MKGSAARTIEFDIDALVSHMFGRVSFSQVILEAVANSIDSGASDVKVELVSNSKIGDEFYLDIKVTDNGSGISERGLDRFIAVRKPKDAKHKGMGRLVFLKFFESAEVYSSCADRSVEFIFSRRHNQPPKIGAPQGKTGTIVHLKGFRKGRRIKAYSNIKPSDIGTQLFREFLPALIEKKQQGEKLKISIELTSQGDQKMLDSSSHTFSTESLPVFEECFVSDPALDAFEGVKIKYSVSQGEDKGRKLISVANVDGRSIGVELFSESALPLGCTSIFILESDLFRGGSDPARQILELPEEISMGALVKSILPTISEIINNELPEVEKRNKETIESIETTYPHLTGLCSAFPVGLIRQEDAIDAAQKNLLRQERELLLAEEGDPDSVQKSINLSARALASYVLYRDWIIKKLSSCGPEHLESVLHNIIIPQRQVLRGKSENNVYLNNAWILDEKFMTYKTVLSDKRMDELIRAIALDAEAEKDSSRPDISIVFSAPPDTEGEKVDVAIVELKKKGVKLKESFNVTLQLRQRARKLINTCENIQRAWYYGVVDIDDELRSSLEEDEWVPLYSKGDVYYREYPIKRVSTGERVPTPMFVMSYDAVVLDAQARNHTFIELLRSTFRGSSRTEVVAEPGTVGTYSSVAVS